MNKCFDGKCRGEALTDSVVQRYLRYVMIGSRHGSQAGQRAGTACVLRLHARLIGGCTMQSAVVAHGMSLVRSAHSSSQLSSANSGNGVVLVATLH